MAGEYDFGPARPGMGGHTSPPKTTAPVAAPKPPQPKWYFNGRTYYSESAYRSAVAAFQQKRKLAASSAAARQKLAAEAKRRAAELRQRQEAAKRALGAQAARPTAQRDQLIERQRLARREAFENLQTRWNGVLTASQDRDRARGAAGVERRAETTIARTTGDQRLDQKLARMGETVTEADVRRGRLLEQARATGDYEAVFRDVRARQARTRGRYVDRKLYDAANKESAQLLSEVREQRDVYVEQIYAAFDQENWSKVIELVEAPEWKDIEARFERYYGGDSVASRWAAQQNAIARDSDRWMSDSILGRGTGGLTDRELERQYQDFERDNLRDAVAPGHGQRLEGNYNEITVQEWLKRQDAEQRLRDAQQMREMQAWQRNALKYGLQAGGIDERVQFHEGQMVRSQDLAQHRQLESMKALFTSSSGGMSEQEFTRLVRQVSNGLPVDRERASRQLVERGVDAYLKSVEGRGWTVQQAKAADALFRTTLERWVYGAPLEGLQGLMSEGMEVPVVGQALWGMQILTGGTTSLARMAQNSLFGGNVALPDFQYDSLFGSGNPLLQTTDAAGHAQGFGPAWDATDAARARNSQEFRELLAVIGEGDSDLGRRLDAIMTYGRGWASGNTAILAEGALDPLSFVTAGRFLRGGRLALAEAGGIRAAARAPGGTLADFLRFSLPKGFGGLDPNDLAQLAERQRVARLTGRDWAEVRNMADDEYRGLVQEAIKEARERSADPVRHMDADAIRSQQVMSAVADELQSIVDESPSIRRVTSQRLQQDVDYARSAAARAEIEERALVARAAREAAEAKGAAALESVRREAARKGVAAPVARHANPLTPTQKGARTALARAHEQLVAERITVARQAVEATTLLEDSKNAAHRAVYHQRMEAAVSRLRSLDDQLNPAPEPGEAAVVAGEVSQARARLDAFDERHGSSPRPPGFVDITLPRVAEDIRFLRAELSAAAAGRKAAKTASSRAWWHRRVERLRAAGEYLEIERRELRGSKGTASRTVRKHGARLREAIAPNRITARAVTQAEGKVELARDIRRQWHGGQVVPDPALDAAERDVLRLLRGDTVNGRSLSSVLSWKTVEEQLNDPFSLRDWEFQSVAQLWALRDQFGDIDLLDLAYAMNVAGFGDAFGRDISDWLRAKLRPMLAEALEVQKITDREIDGFFAAMGREAREATVPTDVMRTFRHLDGEVQSAIREARGWAAEGQIHLRAPKADVPARSIRRDGNLAEVFAKLAALKRNGVSLEAWDQMRDVLGAVNVRYNRGQAIRGQVRSTAKARRITEGEAFDVLRDEARVAEVARNIERRAAQMPGLSDEEVAALFELEMLDRDLAPMRARSISEYQDRILRGAFKGQSGVGIDDADVQRLLVGKDGPPVGVNGQVEGWNRTAMREFMVEHGHWAPRTQEQIRSGQRVFSIADEREFWEAGYGVTPPWTDPDILLPLMRNWDAYIAQFKEWGVFNEDFELLSVNAHLSGEKLRDSIVYGGNGIERARSWDEMRRWAIERYGKVVSEDGTTLTEMPWLMNLDEYDGWLGRLVDDPAALAAAGIEVDPAMVKRAQLESFRDAISQATRRAFERGKKLGEFDEDWLPQEQVRFTMDIVDHLMADPKWRNLFEKKPLAGRVLDNIGAFWRTTMTWTLSFPFMNWLDTMFGRRGILFMTQNGFRPLSRVSDLARELLPTANALGGREATWYIRGRNGFVNAMDKQFDGWFRLREAGRGVTEAPLRLSKSAEDGLRLDFGRSMFDRHYQGALKSGVDEALARDQAVLFALGKVDEFFPNTAGMNGFMRVLNQLVPFFSYNLKLKTIAIRLAADNPWLLLMGERLGDFIEEQNRAWWEKENPGVPFFSGEPKARQLWWRIGDQTYTLDLAGMSDITRGLSLFTEGGRTPAELATQFFRIPHPSQAIMLAALFGFNGGKTPWGTDANWTDISTWFDMANWLHEGGSAAFDPNDPRSRDAIQMLSQMLFFQSFGRISPMKVKVQTFFGFMALDPDKAWEYLNENEDLRAYFALNGSSYRIDPGLKAVRRNWFARATEEERAEYDAAYDGYTMLRDSLDEKLDEFYLEPWSTEYRAWKRRRRALLTDYLRQHPILSDVWGFEMGPSEFAELKDEWLVDEMVDHYMGLDAMKPKRDAFGEGTAGDLAYQRELNDWFDMRAAWLKAHPQVYDRLHSARNEVERAWFDQELQWDEILERASDVKVKQLELQLQLESDPDDEEARALLNTLYDLNASNYAALNADAFGQFYDLVRADQSFSLGAATNRMLGRIRRVVRFPGRDELRYQNATPAERRQIRDDERYAAGFDALWDTIGDDVTRFYDELAKNPWLRNEYFLRNPDKKAAYEAGNEYRGWMGQWVAALERDDFNAAQKVWDSMPAWVHERYFAKHPDSGMRDGSGSGTAVQYNGRWFKSPESRDRYIAFVENGGTPGDFPEGFTTPTSFRSPESRQRFLDGQAYFASMQTWVGMLQAKDYVSAEAYFKGLPTWMQDKYYAKHPDQRARAELDEQALYVGASYFLAGSDAEKLKVLQRSPQLRAWLAEHGGEESAMRGLIQAIYRALPSDEAWLRRTFRERHPEVFSQEAAGERRLASVARDLAENPEMMPFFEKALALQSKTFLEQLKLNKVPPQPWTIERKRRLKKRTKRRAARFRAHWSTHFEARRGIRNSAGS